MAAAHTRATSRDPTTGSAHGTRDPMSEPCFETLRSAVSRPEPFDRYTSPILWNDPHISAQMLQCHLDPSHDRASFPPDHIERCVSWMASHFGIGAGTRVCDFGCGPGLWTTWWAQLGAAVTGIDLSERSIGYAANRAEEQGLTIRYLLGDYLETQPEGFYDLVTMLHGDFSVLSPDQRAQMLTTIRKVLAPGGRVILDVDSIARLTGVRDGTAEHKWHPHGAFLSALPHHALKTTFVYAPERLIAEKYTIVEAHRTFEVLVWSQCYTVATLSELFGAHGLLVEDVFGDLSGTALTDESLRIAAVARARA